MGPLLPIIDLGNLGMSAWRPSRQWRVSSVNMLAWSAHQRQFRAFRKSFSTWQGLTMYGPG